MAVASVLAIAAFAAVVSYTRGRRETAYTGVRPVEPQLTGRWLYAPPPSRGGVLLSRADRLELAAALRPGDGDDDPRTARRAEAIAYLIAGDSAEAVARLTRFSANDPSAETLSDLSAALLVRAEDLDEGDLFVDALAAADRALRIKPDLTPARFNKALALERLGLARHARREWVEFLRRDRSSPWSDEALQHLHALGVRSHARESRTAFAAARAKHHGDPRALADVVRRFPAYSRRASETEVLADWGAATLGGDEAAAARHLAFARAVGGHLRTSLGESMLAESVAAIDRAAQRGDAAALASAYVLYNDARRIYFANNAVAAEPKLRAAGELFARGASPMAYVTRYYIGGVLRAQSRLREASAVLDALERENLDRRGYPALAAQLGWELGGCRLELGAISDAIDVFTRSRPAMERAGEIDSAAWMDAFLANALDFAGDTTAAWRARRRSLASLTGSGNEQRALVVLQSAATAAVHARKWDRARTLLELTAAGATDVRYAPVGAHAFTQLAVVQLRQGDRRGAETSIESARTWVAELPDSAIRARAEADLASTEGILRAAADPQGALALFDRAVGFYERAARRVDLPRTYLERARAATSAGQIGDARRDLETGLGVVAAERSALRDLDQRASLFSAAEELFEEAIDLALAERDGESALRLAEASKARMLTEVFELGSGAVNAEVHPMPLHEIQKSLAPDAGIVAYTALPKRLITFVIRRDAMVTESTPISRELLASEVARFSDAVDANAADVFARSSAADDLLLGKVRPALAGVRHIAFVTDRFTSGVPFSALYDRKSRRLLIEDVSIVSAPSATLLITASRRAAAPSRDSLLAIGANLFDSVTHPRAFPLPNAPIEAGRIARMYPQATLITGGDATVRIAPMLADYGVIHYAGHALPNRDRAGRSALLLAPSGDDHGELRLHDIARLRMRHTTLVVLAACQSAREVTRNDGAENLALGFIAAGVPSVVANLRDLDDRVSQTLMTEFHSRLRLADTPARAIQSVVRQHLRDRSGNIRTPLKWAGFVVVGGSPDLIQERRAR